MVQSSRNHSMPALMVRGVAQLAQRHTVRPAPRTGHHTVDRLIDSPVVNKVCIRTGCKQSSLIKHICQISTGETRGTYGNCVQINIRDKRLALGMDFQDRFTPGKIRGLHGYLAVETPRAHKRRIQDIRPVGGSDNDQVCIVLETVHFHQKLVEGLFTLIHSA